MLILPQVDLTCPKRPTSSPAFISSWFGFDGLLRSISLTVRTHGSVRQLLEAGWDNEPGCIVFDVRLSDTSRLDFREKLASLRIRPPVAVMTGRGDIRMSVRAMKAAAVDFLPKPFREQT
jgi:FixJ family two-component response regulator